MIITIFLLSSLILACAYGKVAEVTVPPQTAIPYVLRNLDGIELYFAGSISRIQATANSSAGDFFVIASNGQTSSSGVPTHYHNIYYEPFFVIKGRVRLFANNETRDLTSGDFGSVPQGTNHSFLTLDPDTQLTSSIMPGGFEAFFIAAGSPFNTTTGTEFDPVSSGTNTSDIYAISRDYDIHWVNYTLNYHETNGTTGGTWHTGNNTLPGNNYTPYFIANSYGPKYLATSLNQVVCTLATKNETGNSTISTIALGRREETAELLSFNVSQVLQVIEGQLSIQIDNATERLIFGDMIYIPPSHSFSYWSDVRFTKVLITTAGYGLDSWLLDQSTSWNAAVWPAN